MTETARRTEVRSTRARTALEDGLPTLELSRIAEQKSWRKEINRPPTTSINGGRPRLGSVFRGLVLGALAPEGSDLWGSFYKKQDFNDRIVLDPFMGSGTTLGEALKLGAKAVGCDINPVSTFLVRQAFTRVPETKLREAFRSLEDAVAGEIRRYYQTRDPQSGELIPVLYCFWVKTLTTPEGEVLPLFSRYVFAQDAYPRKKPRAQIVCASCWAVIEGRYDQTEITVPAVRPYVRSSDRTRVRTVRDGRQRPSAPHQVPAAEGRSSHPPALCVDGAQTERRENLPCRVRGGPCALRRGEDAARRRGPAASYARRPSGTQHRSGSGLQLSSMEGLLQRPSAPLPGTAPTVDHDPGGRRHPRAAPLSVLQHP